MDAILRAFGTWSSNHPLINFKDVSEACLLEGLGRNCTHTEVYITAHAPRSKAQQSFAAYVTALPARCSVEEVFGAGETPDRCKWELSRGRRTTAGVTVADDYAIAYAHVVFNTEVWAAPLPSHSPNLAPIQTLTLTAGLLVPGQHVLRWLPWPNRCGGRCADADLRDRLPDMGCGFRLSRHARAACDPGHHQGGGTGR